MSSRLKQTIPAIMLFVFFFSLYVYTSAPDVHDGDSGEFATAVNELGLAHSTGFPLYMLIGKSVSSLGGIILLGLSIFYLLFSLPLR